ncbi:hypothetical protein B0T25DRAFT_630113 [Lasiosphaeria hispida]|uniref:Vacuolar ATPase assembly protein VMA22 n=1 Tax=Lasiosphaeria hispida TaxID=260671 RepID=A0AAJ0HLG4_9PEZI|nr:hypothetical protein B0T25DRAFT_630113 [Lasiosphaeria hispida]
MASTKLDIDNLLQRYLELLDEYTQLRAALNTLQSGIYHDLARANFSAERGIRYGLDYYDDRMQATRKVAVTATTTTAPSGLVPIFTVSQTNPAAKTPSSPAPAEPTTSDLEEKEPPKPQKHDPLRWFGILTPMPLRHAQTQAVRAVEELLPQLATVSAAMADVELAVRRARKKRAKAEAAAEKAQQQQQQQQQQVPSREAARSSQGEVSL